MSRRFEKPELLAPVGSPEALTAAVRCGADAVYLGAGRFHARQSVQAVDDAALADTVAYCHERGVAVHIALNTLVREDEFSEAMKEAERAAALGADALIVQDRGLAAAIRRAAPTLTLHASTQLSCHTPAGVKALMKEGFDRVVLAREMSREEIKACCEVGCEIETFVHGALCMSVSGQCFLSAMLGGRSGNRGRCAQPCRLPFCVGTKRPDDERALSLKDLSLYYAAAQLGAMGVRSLKIEGRMKRPEYVAAAVSVCRAAIDGKAIDEELLADLQSVFSRSGFTDGYYTGRRDRSMFGSRTKDDVLAAPKAQKRLTQLYRAEHPAVGIAMTLTMEREKPLALTVRDEDGHEATAVGEPPRENESPVSDDRLEAALAKLGGTPCFVRSVTLDRENGSDVPLSAVNALRREAAQTLLRMRAHREPIPFDPKPLPLTAPHTPPARPATVVRLQHHTQWSEALASAVQLTVMPLDTPKERLLQCLENGEVAVEVPRGLFGSKDRVCRLLQEAASCGVKAAVSHNVGATGLIRQAGLAVIGGFGLHTFNRETLALHQRDGLCAATLSFELSLHQMRFARQSPLPVGMTVYGHLPLMLVRNCPAKAQLGCKDCRQERVLTDRKGVSFPLVCQNGCADVLNAVPLYLADKQDDLPKLDFQLFYMTKESPQEVLRVLNAYQNGEPSDAAFTRGSAYKGVE